MSDFANFVTLKYCRMVSMVIGMFKIVLMMVIMMFRMVNMVARIVMSVIILA